jgi:type II secretory pathway pseudopilin PulG
MVLLVETKSLKILQIYDLKSVIFTFAMNLKQIIKTRCKHWTIAEARPKDMQTKEATLLAIKPTCGIKNFTLLEMIVVISIIMVVTGLSFAYMGRMPAGLVIAKSVTDIEKLMTTAHLQATLQGKQKDVVLDTVNKTLFITNPVENIDDLEIPLQFPSTRKASKNKSESYNIPKDISVEVTDLDEERAIYSFFADGSASGPEMIFELKGHLRAINVSQLTGLIIIKDVSEE